jgi:cell division septation protein DedD
MTEGRYAGRAVGAAAGIARRVTICAAAALLFTALPPSRLTAQTDPRLVAALRQAQEGQGDSARATLTRLLDSTPVRDSLYPQILYTAALVTPTAQEMQRHLQRIAVEYTLSEWADDALLKLSQLEYASGNLAGAARNLERLGNDFPASPLLGVASFWAARTYFDTRDERRACAWVTRGLRLAGQDVELRNQLGFFAQRCGPAAAAIAAAPPAAAPAAGTTPATPPRDAAASPPVAADTTPRVSVDTAPPPAAVTREPVTPAPVPSPPAFRVQVVAAPTQAAADAMVAKVKAAGLDAVVVSEGGYFKVRAGSYATRAEASAAAQRLRARLGGAPFVVRDQ